MGIPQCVCGGGAQSFGVYGGPLGGYGGVFGVPIWGLYWVNPGWFGNPLPPKVGFGGPRVVLGVPEALLRDPLGSLRGPPAPLLALPSPHPIHGGTPKSIWDGLEWHCRRPGHFGVPKKHFGVSQIYWGGGGNVNPAGDPKDLLGFKKRPIWGLQSPTLRSQRPL